MNSVVVATDVCAELPPLVAINVDCSLCTIGWPMRKGIVRVTFYGPPCKRWWCVRNQDGSYECVEAMSPPANAVSGPHLNQTFCAQVCGSGTGQYWCSGMQCVQSVTKPSLCDTGPYATFQDCLGACDQSSTPRMESFWLFGFGAAPGMYQCFQPGPDLEPDPTTWGADWLALKYRAQSQISVVDTNTINVTINVFANSPRSIWQSYTSFGATMTEEECTATNPLPYRIRYFKSNYIPVTVAGEVGGVGDPISGAVIHVELYGEQIGCGWPNIFNESMGPLCGMFDGSGWHTCFRAHIESPVIGSQEAKPGVLFEMGLKRNPTGGGNAAANYAECDRIYKDVNNMWACVANSGFNNNGFITEYRVLGFDGENTDDTQQIQTGQTGSYTVVVKKIGTRPMQIGIQEAGSGVWEIASLTTVQSGHPWVHYAYFQNYNITMYLYSLRFPSPEILPGECCATMFPGNENCDPPRASSGFAPQQSAVEALAKIPAKAIKSNNPVLQRMRLPCVNFGEFVENRKLSCGCGTFSVFKCAKFGECVRIAPSTYNEMAHCDNCQFYEAPTSEST